MRSPVAGPPRALRLVLHLALALAALGLLLAAGPAAAAQASLPDVDVMLVAEIPDTESWLAMHQEAIGTAGSTKPLRLGLPAGVGGTRWLRVDEPKFSVAIVPTGGRRLVKLAVTGRLAGSDALSGLVPFEHAAIEVQAGALPNELSLIYGLTVVSGRLLELYFSRP